MAENDPFPISNPPPMYEDIFSTEAEATPAAGVGVASERRRSSWSSDEDETSAGFNLFSDHPPLPGGLVFPEAEDVEAITGLFGATLVEPPSAPSHERAPVSFTMFFVT